MAARFKVPGTFTVPSTIEGVQGLLSARGWERAAIVYAYTKPSQGAGGGPKTSAEKGGGSPERGSAEWAAQLQFPCSFEDFAALKISGLTKPHTVGEYRQRWQDAMRKKWVRAVAPGDTIQVPVGHPWPPSPLTEDRWGDRVVGGAEVGAQYEAEAAAAGTTKDAAIRAGANKAAIEAAIVADPEVAKAARRGLDKRITKVAEKARKAAAERGAPVDAPEPTTAIDHIVDLADGMLEEGQRRDALTELLELATSIHAKADEWAARYGYTGVDDEVEWVHQIGHHLTEAQWQVAKFAVVTEAPS